MSLFYKNTSLISKRLKTRITKESCSGSHATAPNNSSHKIFFFQTRAKFFHHFFKYYVVFQHQPEDSEDCTDDDEIGHMIEVILF